jgi:hypothetical protein
VGERKVIGGVESEDDERKRYAERDRENDELERLNKSNPAAVCAVKGHAWVSLEAPPQAFCRWCGIDKPS